MPGSWELTAQRDQRLLVAIHLPEPAVIPHPFVEEVANILLPPASDFMRIRGGPVAAARNQAAVTALQNGYHLAFLDWNIRSEPDAFLKLMARQLDLVSGLYYQPYWPYEPAFYQEARNPQGNLVPAPILGWNPGDLVPAQLIGAGLVVYRRRLLEALLTRWPRPFECGVDIAPVQGPDGVMTPPLAEGLVASWRARQLGFQPYVDTGVVGLVVTRVRSGPRWMVKMPKLDNPLLGVVTTVSG